MKILTLTNLYPPHGIGGYEERCYQIMHGLAARGHEVEILTSNHSIGESKGETASHPVHRELKIHGFYGHPWRKIHQLYDLEKQNHRTLHERLGSFQPDVVHVWNMGGISKSLLFSLERCGVPMVYDVSDHWIARSLSGDVWLSWWNEKGSVARHALRKVLQWAGVAKRLELEVPHGRCDSIGWKHIYFCSQFMKNLTLQAGYAVENAAVIYCGVEAEKFGRKASYAPPKHFLWVGRLSEDKDPLTAIQAIVSLRERHPDIRLTLYGRGEPDYIASLERAAAPAGGAITFASASLDEMRTIYSQFDALLFTSNWGEPFALTPLEAMASGLPVIMTADGGEAELVRHGENCLVFEAGNATDLAEQVEAFLQREDFGLALAEVAHAELLQRYDMPIIVGQIEEYLQGVLSGGQEKSPEKAAVPVAAQGLEVR